MKVTTKTTETGWISKGRREKSETKETQSNRRQEQCRNQQESMVSYMMTWINPHISVIIITVNVLH